MYQHFRTDRLLKEVSTLGIGGPARYFVEVKEVDKLQELLSFCYKEGMRFFILGKGSNCLFDSQGLDALVIQNKIDFCSEEEPGHFVVGAGYSFSLLGTQTAKRGWSGLEFASGIPASIGGALFMNAAAQGQETSTHLVYVDYVEQDGKIRRYMKEELTFSYRFSSFQKMKGAIYRACFILKPSLEARKKQLQLLQARVSTQPYQEKSAGCVFKNPACSAAGRLIEQCGLKGYRIGGAEVSTIHANFLINAQDATSQDFLDLREYVRKEVERQTGVKLEPEVYWIHDEAL